MLEEQSTNCIAYFPILSCNDNSESCFLRRNKNVVFLLLPIIKLSNKKKTMTSTCDYM